MRVGHCCGLKKPVRKRYCSILLNTLFLDYSCPSGALVTGQPEGFHCTMPSLS